MIIFIGFYARSEILSVNITEYRFLDKVGMMTEWGVMVHRSMLQYYVTILFVYTVFLNV